MLASLIMPSSTVLRRPQRTVNASCPIRSSKSFPLLSRKPAGGSRQQQRCCAGSRRNPTHSVAAIYFCTITLAPRHGVPPFAVTIDRRAYGEESGREELRYDLLLTKDEAYDDMVAPTSQDLRNVAFSAGSKSSNAWMYHNNHFYGA